MTVRAGHVSVLFKKKGSLDQLVQQFYCTTNKLNTIVLYQD